MTLNQSQFFMSGDQSIANSKLSHPGDERKTTTTEEEEEEKEGWMGGGVGSHLIAQRQRWPLSPLRDVMPPSTYASYPIHRFDCHERTAIRAPPVPRRD